MNKRLILLSFLFFIGQFCFGQNRLEIFPQSVNIKNHSECNCHIDTIQLRETVLKMDFGGYKASYDYSKFNEVDIDQDGICEIIHKFSSSAIGWPYDFVSIYKYVNKKLVRIGNFGSSMFSFAERDGTYLTINCGYIRGKKTNPIYYNSVYHFNGDKYILHYRPEKTRKEFNDNGLKAYNVKNYELAYINFCNALRTPHHAEEDYIHDANNVAISLIKMGKYEEVNFVLTKYIDKASNKNELASAYYNLGLAQEKLGGVDNALEFFKKSYSYKETSACLQKIQPLTKAK